MLNRVYYMLNLHIDYMYYYNVDVVDGVDVDDVVDGVDGCGRNIGYAGAGAGVGIDDELLLG